MTWSATGWMARAHHITGGRAACGYSGCDPAQWTPAPADMARCGRCERRLAGRAAPPPWRRIRRIHRRSVLPAGVYAGPDPLTKTISDYEKGAA